MRAALDALEQHLRDPSARSLADAVVGAMRDGSLVPGTVLPPIRTVAIELKLSPTTVSAAWAILRRSGTIATDGRRGTTVSARHTPSNLRYRRALDRETSFSLDLSTGVPDAALLPDLRPALRRLTTTATPASYLDAAVLPELEALLRADWPYPVKHVSIHDGAMDAIELVSRTLIGFGDRVVVENPVFPPLIDLLESLGAQLVAVPVDEEGLAPAALAATLRTPVTAVFLQPRAQNPTGASMTTARERQLASVLADSQAVIVEDDSAGAVAWSAPTSLGRHLPDRTVHVRSFAKSHGPDLRLAALSAPAALMDTFAIRRQLGQGWTSRLLQQVLVNLLTDEGSIEQVRRARVEYRRRRVDLAVALAAQGITVGGSDGMNMWLPVVDETAAVVRLASRGIGVAPGSPFDVLPGGGSHIRVTCGLVGSGKESLAIELASAARAEGWAAPR